MSEYKDLASNDPTDKQQFGHAALETSDADLQYIIPPEDGLDREVKMAAAKLRQFERRVNQTRPVESPRKPKDPELNINPVFNQNPRLRFRPMSRDFNRNARRLLSITGPDLRGHGLTPTIRWRELLARFYGYRNYAELVAILKQPGYEGPYDDEHQPFWQSNEGLDLIAERLAHVNSVLQAYLPDFHHKHSDAAAYLIEEMKLFSSADVQRDAFRKSLLTVDTELGASN